MPTTNQLRKAKAAGLLFGIIALIELVMFAVPYFLGIKLEINLLIGIHDILSLISTLALISVVFWVRIRAAHSSWSRRLLIGSLVFFGILGGLTLGFNIAFVGTSISSKTINLASYTVIRWLVFLLVGWQFYPWLDQEIPIKPLTLSFGDRLMNPNWLLITGILYLIASIFLVPTSYFLFEQNRILTTVATIPPMDQPADVYIVAGILESFAFMTFSIALSLLFCGFITHFWTGYEIYKRIDEVESSHSKTFTGEVT
ncbi:MAG: hypothetical protein ACFFC7_16475 [Candidatus Hermodarchaeota archaeon]